MLRRLHITSICGAILLLLLGVSAFEESVSAQEPLPEVPATITKHVTAHFEGPYLVNGNRIIDRRPTCVIWPSQFEDRVLPGGVLSELLAYPKITGLRLHRGPAMSEAGSQYYEIDVTPAAIADIAALTHLESLDIEAIDLSRGDGLRFLEPLVNLRELRLDDCNVEVQDVLPHLKGHKALEVLSVECRGRLRGQLNDSPARRLAPLASVKDLLAMATRLRSVTLASTEFYEPATVELFAEHRPLRYFDLRYSEDRFVGGIKAPEPDVNQKTAAKALAELFEKNGMERWELHRVLSEKARVYRIYPSMILATERESDH